MLAKRAGWDRRGLLRPVREAAASESRLRARGSSPLVAQPGRVLTTTALLVILLNLGAVFLGGWTTGVSTDEPTHVSRMQNYLDHGWYLPDWHLDSGDPKPEVGSASVYGPVAAIAGHVISVVAGTEDLGTIESTAEAYASRHIAVGLIGLLGVIAVAGIVRFVVGSWRWGLLGAAILVAIPMWTGHAMFNIKDIPVATGYTLVTLGLVALARPGAIASCQHLSSGMGALVLGTVVAVGTRPGMWAAVALSAVVMLGGTAIIGASATQPIATVTNLVARTLAIGLATVSAFLLLLLIYPAAFRTPLATALDSLQSSGDFPYRGITQTAGVEVGQPPPWWYLPVWFGHQIPLLILLLCLVAVSLYARHLVLGRRADPIVQRSKIAFFLVMTQAAALPIGAIATDSTLYNAARQMLFVVPALAALATLGAALLLSRLHFLRHGITITSGAIVLTLLAPTIEQARLFPYNYTYLNPIATLQPVNNRWETDYWGLSYRELAPLIGSDGLTHCSPPYAAASQQAAARMGLPTLQDQYGRLATATAMEHDCVNSPLLGPYISARGLLAAETLESPTQFWFVKYNRIRTFLPSNCTLVDEVARPLRGQSIMMSYLAKCEMAFAVYPDDGISFAENGEGDRYTLDGWAPPDAEGTRMIGQQAQIGLALPQRLRDQALSLQLRGRHTTSDSDPQPLFVYVNDTLVNRSMERDGNSLISVDVPTSITQTLDRNGLIVRLATTTSASSENVNNDHEHNYRLDQLRITEPQVRTLKEPGRWEGMRPLLALRSPRAVAAPAYRSGDAEPVIRSSDPLQADRGTSTAWAPGAR